MKRKHGVLANGLSVPIAWLFCCGMMYADPQQQANYRLRRLSNLLGGAIQTDKDVSAVDRILEECAEHQPLETGKVRGHLISRNLFYTESLQDAA